MEKLVVVIIGQNCQKFIGMCLESVKDVDDIVFLDGGSKDKTQNICEEFGLNHFLVNEYHQEDKGMNGKQRNFYLDYIKKNYPDYWVLCIDADEVVENLDYIKKWIQNAPKGVYSPRMRHLINYLNYEDSIEETHFVLNRLFHISKADKYPEKEHPILLEKGEQKPRGIKEIVIWHLSYISAMFDIKKKYLNHLKKSTIHTKEYLDDWYFKHIFNLYPKKQFNPLELPDVILNEFKIDRDKLYFQGRQNMEIKHYQDCLDWKNYFNPKTVTIYGCGMGQRVKVFNELGIDATGIELSKYAVEHRLHKNIIQGDITKDELKSDLGIAYDVLEHLEYNDLNKSIENLKGSKKILVSIPVIGNPSLDMDPTHIIKETEEWWINKFKEHGLERIKTPNYFLYKEQIYIFKKETK